MPKLPARKFVIALATGAALFAAAPAVALDDAEKQEIGAFIREYLVANPEILLEVQEALQTQQATQQQAQAAAAIESESAAIFQSDADLALGNPEGDVTIVEFFDYNCGYCQNAMADMEAIIESDPDVRFVLKEFPILGPESLEAHRVSMALRSVAPEEYAAFHRQLLGGGVRADEDRAIEIATSLGVSESALRAEMDDPAIDADIEQTYRLATALGITGTPSYVIEDEAVFGALGAEVLAEKVENVRTCQSATC